MKKLVPKRIEGYNIIVEELPRILKYQIDKNKDFRAIDHNTELSVSTERKEYFGEEQSNRALLLKKEYYVADELLFFIEYTYKFNTIGEITHQSLILKWLNENGTINLTIKDKGFRKLSKKESREIVAKRRDSVIELLEIQIMELLSSKATNEEETQISINIAANMMAEVSTEINKFKNSGNHQSLIDKLNLIKTTYTFLQEELIPGLTVINYISNFLDY